MDLDRQLEEAIAAIRERTRLQPRMGIVLGSGLGSLAAEIDDQVAIPYRQIPHFPVSTTAGHSGTLVLGSLEGVPVAVMAGRVHLYEGYAPEQVVFPVRTLRGLGAETLLITNAAGGINTEWTPGTLMLITDHINFTGRSPLVGANDEQIGPRFPDMSVAYSYELRVLARRVAESVDVPLVEGVYMGFLGPQFETPAEIRAARILGADAVGMSTVMEVIAAAHAGMRVVGVSCITNMAAGMLPEKLSAEEVYTTAAQVAQSFKRLIRGIVREYGATATG